MTVAAQSTILRAATPLGPVPARIGDDLGAHARTRPGQPFLAERDGAGWRFITYGQMLERVRRAGAGIIEHGATAERPIVVLAENSIAHALVAFGAMHAGVPYAPVSIAVARADVEGRRLRAIVELLTPAFAFATEPAVIENLRRAAPELRILTGLGALDGDPAVADAAFAATTPDTIAKILFTSGSTGAPKGVITTQRMLTANTSMYAAAWPFVMDDPIVLDWLPWSHCFGGNHNLGMVLRGGGTLWIDEGRPVPGLIDATLRNLREVSPTIAFNVPAGWALLADAFEHDAELARRFFSRLRLVSNAAASLPDVTRARLNALIDAHAPHPIAIVSSWGATETAPLATGSWGDPMPDLDTIGVPVPGVEIKLAPLEDYREIRVRGANVTPGYWRNAAATHAAFDEDGFYKSGDAAALRDPARPERGIDFRGRIAENFKLSSGTWVNVGALRLALLDALAPYALDIAVAGADRDALGILIFPSPHPAPPGAFARALAAHNANAAGSSTRIARALVLGGPPDRAAGEITDKGSINQRRVLDHRTAEVARLFATPGDPTIIVLDTGAIL
ncbi:MAG: AMP-binding protein [Candidatus Velthaea sp.]|jgi:feruloyl-CoA synthase